MPQIFSEHSLVLFAKKLSFFHRLALSSVLCIGQLVLWAWFFYMPQCSEIQTKKVLLKSLEKQHQLARIITYTSRAPRVNEINGKDYFFISYDDFLCKIKEGFFLETNEYNGALYGSPKSIKTDLEHGKSLIIITDHNGAKSIKQLSQEFFIICFYVTKFIGCRILRSKAPRQRD